MDAKLRAFEVEDGGVVGAVSACPQALIVHLVGGVAFVLGATGVRSRSGWRSMAPFYVVLAFALPLLGMLTVLGLNRMLSAPRNLVVDRCREAQFLIAGPTDEDEEYAEACMQLAEQLDLDRHVKFLGAR